MSKKKLFTKDVALFDYPLFRGGESHPAVLYKMEEAWYWGGSKWIFVPFVREFLFYARPVNDKQFSSLAYEKHADLSFIKRLGQHRNVICSSEENLCKDYIIPERYHEIAECTFWNCNAIGSVTIPSTVSVIGPRAFSGCENLTEIKIPDSVNVIGEGAFSKCIRLKEISLPDSVATFEDSCFAGCVSLRSVRLPLNTCVIGASSFKGCRMLEEITLPDSLTWIQDSAFKDCQSLKEIFIPDSVRRIEKNAFENCKSLKNVSVPDGLEIVFDTASVNIEIRKIPGLNRIVMQEPPKYDWQDDGQPDRMLNQYVFTCGSGSFHFSDYPDFVMCNDDGVMAKADGSTGISMKKLDKICEVYNEELKFCNNVQSFCEIFCDMGMRFSFSFVYFLGEHKYEDIWDSYITKLQNKAKQKPEFKIPSLLEQAVADGYNQKIIELLLDGHQLSKAPLSLFTKILEHIDLYLMACIFLFEIGISEKEKKELLLQIESEVKQEKNKQKRIYLQFFSTLLNASFKPLSEIKGGFSPSALCGAISEKKDEEIRTLIEGWGASLISMEPILSNDFMQLEELTQVVLLSDGICFRLLPYLYRTVTDSKIKQLIFDISTGERKVKPDADYLDEPGWDAEKIYQYAINKRNKGNADAATWMGRAALCDYPMAFFRHFEFAIFDLKILCTNPLENIKALEILSDLGDTDATITLGIICLGEEYIPGRKVRVRNGKSEALKYFKNAADNGNKYGIYCLALCYYYGIAVEQDYKKAFELFEKANAIFMMRYMAFMGRGTKKNVKLIFKPYSDEEVEAEKIFPWPYAEFRKWVEHLQKIGTENKQYKTELLQSLEEWVPVLIEHPELATQCDWNFPRGTSCPGDKWCELLSKQPQFADKCEWDKLGTYNWVELLISQPQFADKCPWDKIKNDQNCYINFVKWVDLVVAHPQFLQYCPVHRLWDCDFLKLLAVYPQCAEQHSWDISVSPGAWVDLLIKQPQFADKCPWMRMTDYHEEWDRDDEEYSYSEYDDLGRLFAAQPQLFQRCNQANISSQSWTIIKKSHPELAELPLPEGTKGQEFYRFPD